MDCPKCIERLRSEQYRKRDYLVCFYCEGVWLEKADLEAYGSLGKLIAIKKSEHLCPHCTDHRLDLIEAAGCELEHCSSCGGVFFDKNELEQAFPSYRELDGEALVTDTTEAVITLTAITGFIVGIFKAISR